MISNPFIKEIEEILNIELYHVADNGREKIFMVKVDFIKSNISFIQIAKSFTLLNDSTKIPFVYQQIRRIKDCRAHFLFGLKIQLGGF